VEDYKENDTNSVMKYRHVEFPNSATRRNRQCQTILSEQVPTMDRFKLNFAGMDDMDNWFIAKDSSKHLENALRWRGCNSDSARKKFTKSNRVRWSELLRLPYFDPIRFIIVDPMYCL